MERKSRGSNLTTEARQLLADKSLDTLKDSGDFIAFLLHCTEKLNKGAPVQAIWDDYQAKVH